MKRLLVCLFLLLLSCTSDKKPELDYRTGTEGIVLRFSTDRPSSIVYSGDKANVMVEVWNKGAEPMEYGLVYLSGFDPNAIKFSGYDTYGMYVYDAIPFTPGRTQWDAVGGYSEVEFYEDNGVVVPFGDVYKGEIMATSCYLYSTLATPEVCVLSKPEQLRTEKVCWPEVIALESQGAPVAVTKVEEHIMENKLGFVVHVENKGDGTVVSRESLSKCPFALMPTDKDRIHVELEMSGSGEIACKPADRNIRLYNKQGIIYCEVPIELETFWKTPLNIRLSYGYSSSTKKPFEIRNAPANSSYTGEQRTKKIQTT